MARYADAIEWIAMNDESGDGSLLDPATLEDMISIQLVADLWSKAPIEVARAVIRYRRKEGI